MFRAGEPIEVILSVPGGQMSIENATFVGMDESDAVVRLNTGKHKNVNLALIQKRGVPYQSKSCAKCGTLGKWVDHGPAVGKGWYCSTCKEDIPSDANTYGITGKQFVQKTTAKPKYISLNCGKKDSCSTCGGAAKSMPPVDVKRGDSVVCVINTGTKLQRSHIYKVYAVHEDSIELGILMNTTKYSRCRFALV